ncbi:MAG: hypothetical protein CSA70_06235 [Rhodobacterales bacterium]|nr:MAG: hypothetical protein CSA70_06235 [Rhodobacterales bacterium]
MRDSLMASAHADALNDLLAARLGLRRGGFVARMSRAGRRLPRHLHRDGEMIAQAMALETHPKLRRRVDTGAVAQAHDRIRDHLLSIDPADRRKGAILSLLASLAVNLLGVAALLLAVLKWRGFL